MGWVFIAGRGLSLAAASGHHAAAAAPGAGHRLQGMRPFKVSRRFCLVGTQAQYLWVHGLSYPAACGIFPDRGSAYVPVRAGGFLTTELSGSPLYASEEKAFVFISGTPLGLQRLVQCELIIRKCEDAQWKRSG